MNLFDATILGLVQGLTEFIPVSSSGHLIIVREFLGISLEGSLLFDAVLHLATVLAVIVYFHKDLWKLLVGVVSWITGDGIQKKEKTLLGALVLGTIPAVFFGLFFEKGIESVVRSTEVVAWALLLGSVLFFVAERFAKQNKTITPSKGWWIGFFQALALIPGMSRSGSSISGGLLLGLNREEATRFAFLLSLPILLGVGLRSFMQIGQGNLIIDSGLFGGSFVAFVIGLIAIHFMIRYLKNNSLQIFIVYRVLLSFILLVMLYV